MKIDALDPIEKTMQAVLYNEAETLAEADKRNAEIIRRLETEEEVSNAKKALKVQAVNDRYNRIQGRKAFDTEEDRDTFGLQVEFDEVPF